MIKNNFAYQNNCLYLDAICLSDSRHELKLYGHEVNKLDLLGIYKATHIG